jgi:hypothetical protein
VVNEQQGAEEYVHLKSVEDEIEFLEVLHRVECKQYTH